MGKGAGGFIWRNCNKTLVPFAFRSLSLSPNPIQYGKDLVISAELDVTKPVGTTHSLKVCLPALFNVFI